MLYNDFRYSIIPVINNRNFFYECPFLYYSTTSGLTEEIFLKMSIKLFIDSYKIYKFFN